MKSQCLPFAYSVSLQVLWQSIIFDKVSIGEGASGANVQGYLAILSKNSILAAKNWKNNTNKTTSKIAMRTKKVFNLYNL